MKNNNFPCLEEFTHCFIIKTIGTVEYNALLLLVLKSRPVFSQLDEIKTGTNFKTNLS